MQLSAGDGSGCTGEQRLEREWTVTGTWEGGKKKKSGRCNPREHLVPAGDLVARPTE